jgi:hypothetical protein
MTEASPLERWAAVPPETQRQVERLARRGRAHPDPEVSATALAWAEVILAAHEVEQEERLPWVERLLGGLFPVEALNDSLHARAERRWARKVIAASGGSASPGR